MHGCLFCGDYDCEHEKKSMKNKTQYSLIPKPTANFVDIFDQFSKDIQSSFDILASPFFDTSYVGKKFSNLGGTFSNNISQYMWKETNDAFVTEITIPRFTKDEIKLSI